MMNGVSQAGASRTELYRLHMIIQSSRGTSYLTPCLTDKSCIPQVSPAVCREVIDI